MGGALILGCSVLGVGVYFLFTHEIEVPVVAADRGLVVTARRVAECVPTLHVDPAREAFHKVRTLDGSKELAYKYSLIDDEGNLLFVNHRVYVDRTIDDAQGGYIGLGIGTSFGFRQIREVARDDLWKWGDASRCTLLMKDDKKVGNIFKARKGWRYFILIIGGVYFEEAGSISELLDPFLQRFDAYQG